MYNLTALATVGGDPVGFMQGINDLVGGWFFSMLLFAFFIMCFIGGVMAMDPAKAAAGASIIALVIALPMIALQFIPMTVFIVTVVVAAGSNAFAWKKT